MKNLFVLIVLSFPLLLAACPDGGDTGGPVCDCESDPVPVDDDDGVDPTVYSDATLEFYTWYYTDNSSPVVLDVPTYAENVAFMDFGIRASEEGVQVVDMGMRMIGDLENQDSQIINNTLGERLKEASAVSSPGACQVGFPGSPYSYSDSARVWDGGEFIVRNIQATTHEPSSGLLMRARCSLTGADIYNDNDVLAVEVTDVSHIKAFDAEGLPIHPDNITLLGADGTPGGLNVWGEAFLVNVVPGLVLQPPVLEIEDPFDGGDLQIFIGEDDQEVLALPVIARFGDLEISYSEICLNGLAFDASTGNFDAVNMVAHSYVRSGVSIEGCIDGRSWDETIELPQNQEVLLRFTVDIPEDSRLTPGLNLFAEFQVESLVVTDPNTQLPIPPEDIRWWEYDFNWDTWELVPAGNVAGPSYTVVE